MNASSNVQRALASSYHSNEEVIRESFLSVRNSEQHAVAPFSAASKYGSSTLRSLDFASRMFKKQEATIRASYQQSFDGLGFPEGLSELAIIQISEIEQKRLQAQALLDEVEYHKADYDQIMRSSLSEQDYQNYRDLEAKKFQQAYVDDFNKYLAKEQIQNLGQDEMKELEGLLSSINGGVTIDKSTGPYGVPGSVSLAIFEEGTEQLYNEDRISLLAGERDYLLGSVSSDSLREAVGEYYSARIREYSDF